MRRKVQVLIVHGGMTFRNRKDYLHFLRTRSVSIVPYTSWSRDYLTKKLVRGYEIIRLQMPLKDNARYEDWKIHFKRFFPYLKNNIILIGSSLGGIFLAKYLSEHKFPKKIMAAYLVAPPFDNTAAGEDLVGGFRLKSNLSLLGKNVKNLYLLFSEDDPSVPVSHAEKYRRKLPNAHIIVYKGKHGHFRISKFPEIVAMIRKVRGRK